MGKENITQTVEQLLLLSPKEINRLVVRAGYETACKHLHFETDPEALNKFYAENPQLFDPRVQVLFEEGRKQYHEEMIRRAIEAGAAGYAVLLPKGESVAVGIESDEDFGKRMSPSNLTQNPGEKRAKKVRKYFP